MGSARYIDRTRRNVQTSDATIIFTPTGELSLGNRKAQEFCTALSKPCLAVCLCMDVDDGDPKDKAEVNAIRQNTPKEIRDWLRGVAAELCDGEGKNVISLNITGTRESKSPGIQKLVRDILIKTLS
jgi:hypothetical protein